MILENVYLHVEIASAGAELMHVYNRKTQTELLWNGDPAYWKRRSPVLFPNVGKTYGNVMRINGKTYPTAQHGFARDMDFTLESADENSCCYLLKSSEETLSRYPFPFELRIAYELQDAALKVSWKVKNPGTEEMYFTIGGHPAFCFDAGGKKTDYLLLFPGLKELKYLLLDETSGTACADRICTLPLQEEKLLLTDELFAHDALILDGAQVKEVWLCKKDGSRRVGMKCEGFPNYGVWSVQGAPFVCLEPWQGRCDNCGFGGELRDKENITRLLPGEEFEKSYTIVLPE